MPKTRKARWDPLMDFVVPLVGGLVATGLFVAVVSMVQWLSGVMGCR